MKTYPIFVKAVYLLLLAFLLFYGMVYAKFILIPLTLACLFAILLTPLATLFERWGVHKTLASLLCILVMFVIVGILIFLLSRQIMSFITDLPSITGKINSRLTDIQAYIERRTHLSPTRQISWLQQEISDSSSLFTPAISATTSTFATVALVPLYTFFLLFYRLKILVFFEKVTPEQNHFTVHQIIHKIKQLVQSYLSGVIIVIFIIALIVGTGLAIIGVPYAIFLGALAGILNVIPYLGILTAAVMSVVLATMTNDAASVPILVFFLFLGTHMLEANIITPNIVGSKVSINPLASLLALVLGAEVWGIAGMILFIPMLGIVKVVFDNIKELQPYGFLLGMEPNENATTWRGTLGKVKRFFVRLFAKKK
jgi:predicted PurR-regulated permease PerM